MAPLVPISIFEMIPITCTLGTFSPISLENRQLSSHQQMAPVGLANVCSEYVFVFVCVCVFCVHAAAAVARFFSQLERRQGLEGT